MRTGKIEEQKEEAGGSPGCPVVETSPSNAGCMGQTPGQGAKTPHGSQPQTQNVKQKQYFNKFNKGGVGGEA